MSKRAREAYPDKYAAALARKRQRTGMYSAPSPALKAMVRKEVARQGDLKYADYFGSFNVTNSGTVTSLLSNMTRGDNGLNMHQGNIITPRYLQIDYFYATQQLYNSLRLIVFQWSETTTPTLASVLQSTTSGIATISPINISSKSEIRVLADHKCIVAPSAGGDTTPIGYGTNSGSIFIPAKRLRPVRFNTSANLVQSDNIYVLYVSDDGVPVYPTLNLYSRLAFTD